MSYFPIVGSKCYLSTGLEAGKTVSNITNAAPPVASSTSHGYSNDDEVLMVVGWEDFNGSVFRVSNVATNTFELTGYDSTDTDLYPQGSDTGTAYEITGWEEIGQVLSITSSGGDMRSIDLNPYDKRNGIKIPTGFNPAGLEFVLGYDRTLTAQQSLLTASRSQAKLAFKFLLAGPSYAYAYGYVSASEMPSFEDVLRRRVAVSVEGLFTSFS